MVVGEAPGREEDLEPFVGDAGQELNALLRLAGLRREDVFVSNLIKCRPPRNRDPKQEEIDICSSLWLRAEIARTKPRLIVTLGRFASSYMLGRPATMEEIHGRPQRASDGGPVFPCYHPAAGLHNTRLLGAVREDFLNLGRYLRGQLEPPSDLLAANYSEGFPPPAPVVALDTESDDDGNLICITVATEPGVAYMIKDPEHIRLYLSVLRQCGTMVAMHNPLYDMKVLEPYGGLRWEKVIDTLLLAAHLGEPEGSRGLKELAQNKLGMEMVSYEQVVGAAYRRRLSEWALEKLAEEKKS